MVLTRPWSGGSKQGSGCQAAAPRQGPLWPLDRLRSHTLRQLWLWDRRETPQHCAVSAGRGSWNNTAHSKQLRATEALPLLAPWHKGVSSPLEVHQKTALPQRGRGKAGVLAPTGNPQAHFPAGFGSSFPLWHCAAHARKATSMDSATASHSHQWAKLRASTGHVWGRGGPLCRVLVLRARGDRARVRVPASPHWQSSHNVAELFHVTEPEGKGKGQTRSAGAAPVKGAKSPAEGGLGGSGEPRTGEGSGAAWGLLGRPSAGCPNWFRRSGGAAAAVMLHD